MANYQPVLLGQPGRPKVPLTPPEGKGAIGLLMCPKSQVLYLVVSVSAIWFEYGIAPYGQGSDPGSIEWQGATMLLPVTMSDPKDFDAVRVWRFLETGKEPQVSFSVG